MEFLRFSFIQSVYTIEGDPRYWEIQGEKFQLGLVRACEVRQTEDQEKLILVNGPAVVIFSEDVTHIEFIEELYSSCGVFIKALADEKRGKEK